MLKNLANKQVIWFLYLNAIDTAVTTFAIESTKQNIEWQPAYRKLIDCCGLYGLFIGKFVLVMIVLFALVRFKKLYWLKYLNIGLLVIVIFNIFSTWSWSVW